MSPPAAAPRALAAAWAAAALVALSLLAAGPGVSRDEAAVLAAAERPEAWEPAAGLLAPPLARAARAVALPAGLSDLRALRLGSALVGALLAALLALAARRQAGAAGALLAPALFWFAPRHLHAGLVATPDLALAALALAAVLAWRRSARGGRGRLPAAAVAGVLVAAAMAARADAWVLVPAFAVQAALAALLDRRAAAEGRSAAPARRAGALALAVALAAGLAVAGWPELLRGDLSAFGRAAGGGALPAPAAALLALPATLLLAYAGGALHALARLARALRARAPAAAVSDDLLLLAAAVAALAGSALAPAPAGGRPALHAMPFLALLGARALLRACAVAWERRAAPLVGAVALLVLYPALRATVRAHPHGASAWGELAGGAPGAASLDLPRQDGGEAVAALLAVVNERAREGARVWWPSTPATVLALHARDGRLRADLAVASGPEEADLAVVAVEDGRRDAEYRAWSALRTARPVAGVYADELPLAFVYARAGAWR